MEIPRNYVSLLSDVLRRFPFGGGSSGVRLYVTVRVTTCLTLTGFAEVALLGVFGARSCQLGEKAQWVLVALRGVALYGVALNGVALYGVALYGDALYGVAARGESFMDNVLSDCGIRSRRRAGGDLGDLTLHGERGGRENDGDLRDSAEEKAGLVALDG